MCRHLIVAFLLLASSLTAQPLITSLSPTMGSTSGGTEVTITGSGFVSTLGQRPVVMFGDFPARSVGVVSSTTIRAVSPAQPFGNVTVVVVQPNGAAASPQWFSYTGRNDFAVQRYLLPIFVPPVVGAYGSEFRSELRLWNPTAFLGRIWGAPSGPLVVGPDYVDLNPLDLLPSTGQASPSASASGGPGRLIDITRDAAEGMAMNLRVYDTSRSAQNFGTELPIVPDTEFRPVIALTGVPLDPRYRWMLRVYGLGWTYGARVTIGNETRQVRLSTPVNIYDPPYAQIVGPEPVAGSPTTTTIRIEGLAASPLDPIHAPKVQIWAFVSITNNETQHITTITPQ
ncbi:MAG: IPT/TIG domain-containing protein [Thermoanaerobaculia bacterium]